MSDPAQLDLLDLLSEAETPARDGVVHAVLPNIWRACGWCVCGCQGRMGEAWTLRRTEHRSVTCTG